MRALYVTLEYGARIVGILLVVVGFFVGSCVGVGYLVGFAMEDPFPVGPGELIVLLLPLGAGIVLYVLSGVFKALAEEQST